MLLTYSMAGPLGYESASSYNTIVKLNDPQDVAPVLVIELFELKKFVFIIHINILDTNIDNKKGNVRVELDSVES